MDLNLTLLCGTLATQPELRVFDSGTRLIRFLVIVKTDAPRRRTDVIPVTYWDPPDELVDDLPGRGIRIWVCGSTQRRYWEGPDGRPSRIEIVAEQVVLKHLDELEPMQIPA